MKFYLIVARGKRQGFPIPITVDLFLIGSDPMCQLRAEHRRIGAQHCALVNRERKVFVRDLGSGLPTLVNDALVPAGEEWPLHVGDRLTVGPLQFVVQFREKPLSGRDLEEWALKSLDRVAAHDMTEAGEDFYQAPRTAHNAAQAAAAIFDRMQAKRGLVQGRLRIGREGGVTLVRFNDRYLVEEAEVALIRKELFDNLNRPNLRVLLDCKHVRRLSTAAMAMLAELRGWLKPWGSTLAVCRVRAELRSVLADMAKGSDIPYFADKKAALAGRW
jgi:pSer/pThr/pTyr-binding forkhead associated (FHA) protein